MARRAIGIAGSTGSGKSTLAFALAERLGGVVLHTDDYYRPLDHLSYEERCAVNFDEPAAVDGAQLARDVAALLRGTAIHTPRYDFSRHTQSGDTRPIQLRDGEVLIVEGIFALSYPMLRALFDQTVFVDTAEGECLRRRLVRDVQERGRTPEEVVERFTGHVAPMFRQHVLPHRLTADVVVSGEHGIQEALRGVLDRSPLALV